MNSKDLNLLKTICKRQRQTDLRAYLVSKLRKVANVEMNKGNLYITKGEAQSYPCFAAHMDTVHTYARDFKIFRTGDIIFAYDAATCRQTGIGGDDRTGVYMAIKLLEILPACKIVFFRDEETGGKGSDKADKDFFNNCRFIGQIDRRGNSDIVFDISGTTLAGNDFKDAVKPIIKGKLKQCIGAFTDVHNLKKKGILPAMFNISAGYYNPHTSQEYIDLEDVDKILDILIQIGQLEKMYSHKYTAPKYDSYKSYNRYTYTDSRAILACSKCKTHLVMSPEWAEKYPNSHWKNYCPTCKEEKSYNEVMAIYAPLDIKRETDYWDKQRQTRQPYSTNDDFLID